MQLNVSEELHLDASPEDVWKLLRDTPRLTRLLPGVESVEPLDEPGVEAYAATASDKIGPFKVTFQLQVRVAEAREASLLRAALRGADSFGINRVTGSLEIALEPAPTGTLMRFSAAMEILGKLATLGAVPVRRRTAQSFAEFARNIQAQFAKKEGA